MNRTLRARPTLTRSTRGSIIIEFLILVPLLVIIWMGIWYVGKFGLNASKAQQQARECAWEFAHSECRVAVSCRPSATIEVDDSTLEQTLAAPLAELDTHLPDVADEFEILHGHAFSVSERRDVQRPALFGGDHTVSGAYATMCQTPTGTWTPSQIFDETCPILLDGSITSDWCP